MKTHKLLLAAAAALSACGCASFTSGDVLVEKETAQAMFDDHTLAPFADIQLSWINYPYRSPTDSIAGETTVDDKGRFTAQQAAPVQVPPEDLVRLAKRARGIFSEAGLYDKQKGRGTLRLALTTVNRWTYGELFRSYLVDTGFIFLIPSSLRVNYLLSAEFETSSGTVKVETLGQNKTTFHLLLAPLYPLFAPGGRETGLLKQMLWRCATDTYSRLKHEGRTVKESPAAAAPPAQAGPEKTEPPARGPVPAEETPDD